MQVSLPRLVPGLAGGVCSAPRAGLAGGQGQTSALLSPRRRRSHPGHPATGRRNTGAGDEGGRCREAERERGRVGVDGREEYIQGKQPSMILMNWSKHEGTKRGCCERFQSIIQGKQPSVILMNWSMHEGTKRGFCERFKSIIQGKRNRV